MARITVTEDQLEQFQNFKAQIINDQDLETLPTDEETFARLLERAGLAGGGEDE